MLQICGIESGRSGTVTFDEYIPVSFRAYEGVLAGPPMWRTGNMDTDLLEIKIEPDIHSVVGITFVSYHGFVAKRPLFSLTELPMEDGIPVVDTTIFPNIDFPRNRLDEPIELIVALHDAIEIAFGKEVVPIRQLICGRFHFLIDREDFLCGVAVSGISANERMRIEKNIDNQG